MMVPFFGVVIYDMVSGFTFQDTADALKNIQIAVYCGFIHSGHLFVNVRNYLFCGKMRP
jgi:hypothetical protein